jgi:hypothetical protein
MRTAIHINDAETIRPADIKDDDPLKVLELHNLKSVCRPHLTRTGIRLATRVRRVALKTDLARFI